MIASLQLDTRQVENMVNAMPQQIFQASLFAVNKTAAFAQKRLQGEMATRADIPKTVWRRYRTAKRFNRSVATGTVWLGLNQIKAAYAGKMRQDAHGAWSGKRYFDGGFIATMKSGHTGIFKRTGVRGLRGGKWWTQIEEQSVDVNLGFQVANEVATAASAELDRQFIDRVLALNPYLKNAQ